MCIWRRIIWWNHVSKQFIYFSINMSKNSNRSRDQNAFTQKNEISAEITKKSVIHLFVSSKFIALVQTTKIAS